jgi:hypothetical protein
LLVQEDTLYRDPSVLLPFTYLVKRVSTKTGITEKGNFYKIEFKIKKEKEKNKKSDLILSKKINLKKIN